MTDLLDRTTIRESWLTYQAAAMVAFLVLNLTLVVPIEVGANVYRVGRDGVVDHAGSVQLRGDLRPGRGAKSLYEQLFGEPFSRAHARVLSDFLLKETEGRWPKESAQDRVPPHKRGERTVAAVVADLVLWFYGDDVTPDGVRKDRRRHQGKEN